MAQHAPLLKVLKKTILCVWKIRFYILSLPATLTHTASDVTSSILLPFSIRVQLTSHWWWPCMTFEQLMNPPFYHSHHFVVMWISPFQATCQEPWVGTCYLKPSRRRPALFVLIKHCLYTSVLIDRKSSISLRSDRFSSKFMTLQKKLHTLLRKTLQVNVMLLSGVN